MRVGSALGNSDSISLPTTQTTRLPQLHASPVSPRILGAEEGRPGLWVVAVVRVDPGLPAVGVPSGGAPPEGVSHVQEGS